MVDVRDVAACAVAALLADESTSGAWQLTGPRPGTFPLLAARVGARHLTVPVKVAISAMRRRGLAAFEVEHAARMASYFAAGSDGTATDHVLRLTGRPPPSIETLLAERRSTFAPASIVAQVLSRSTIEERKLIMVTRIGHIALHVKTSTQPSSSSSMSLAWSRQSASPA